MKIIQCFSDELRCRFFFATSHTYTSFRHANLYDVDLEQCKEFGIVPDKIRYETGFQ
ncbi:MAG: hypothetical protein PHY93_17535 [Bacteriovorax sp.]|nr:hypothetical protein [Bacteriovorax sp.]